MCGSCCLWNRQVQEQGNNVDVSILDEVPCRGAEHGGADPRCWCCRLHGQRAPAAKTHEK